MTPKMILQLGIGLLLLNVTAIGITLGEDTPEDSDIFPFSSGRTIEYSEDFYDITDNGVYDASGNKLVTIDEKENNEERKNTPENSADFEAYQATIINNWGDKKVSTQKRLEGIKENLGQEMLNFVGLEKKIGQIEKELLPIQEKMTDLKGQIGHLNDQLKISKDKIKNTEFQIAEKEIELKEALLSLKTMEARLKIQEKAVLDYIQLVYHEEERFLDYQEKGSSTIKLLLADSSVSENLMGKEYSRILHQTGRKVFYELHDQKQALEEKRKDIQKEKIQLDELYQNLKEEKQILEEGKAAKKDLLEKTLGEEDKYEKLLEESIQQQLESAIAIQNMKDNISFIQGKLSLLDESAIPSSAPQIPNELKGAYQEESTDEPTFSFQPQLETVPEETQFIWPVPPLAVTAEFRDPHYPKKWGTHNAIDLRAKQFTEIVAPANGYVFQTKDNGMGYSYIILAHKNNLVTVYGHVTEILVKPGTIVKQGEVIGLSGGTPGTKGAGLQTTGPHLHFEVWKNGESVDPLDYLPIFELPIEYIPDRFLKK